MQQFTTVSMEIGMGVNLYVCLWVKIGRNTKIKLTTYLSCVVTAKPLWFTVKALVSQCQHWRIQGGRVGPISFIFMQFSAKILSNNRFLVRTQGFVPPVWENLDPPLFKSHITGIFSIQGQNTAICDSVVITKCMCLVVPVQPFCVLALRPRFQLQLQEYNTTMVIPQLLHCNEVATFVNWRVPLHYAILKVFFCNWLWIKF